MNYSAIQKELNEEGFVIIPDFFTNDILSKIESLINGINLNTQTVLKTKELFAIRQFINVIPEIKPIIFNSKMKALIQNVGNKKYFLSKAIYFDKPSDSNWFVPYHQDLSISVDKKATVPRYSNWTEKHGQFGVHPPQEILENTITLRLHLDDTDCSNGALKVLPKSHKLGVVRKEYIKTKFEKVCNISRGGVMLMKPLVFHASRRSNGKTNRRVIHLEFNSLVLGEPLKWLEYNHIFN